MNLSIIDLLIIGACLATTVVMGLSIKRQASRSQADYMLGGKKLPWYLLGVSNALNLFDMSGLVLMVTLCFVYGVKSMWLVGLLPVCSQVFQMAYLSKWLRRSNVSTGAEWLKTRFGTGEDSELAHIITVVFALIGCVGFLAYGFVGLGKLIEMFLPWEVVAPYLPFSLTPQYIPHLYGLLFMLFVVFYAVVGGMQGVVWGDVFLYGTTTLAAIAVAIIAMSHLDTQVLRTPVGWANPFLGWDVKENWASMNPNVTKKIEEDGFALGGAFFMMLIFKGIFTSLAGTNTNHEMQKILAAQNPEDASKMSGWVSVVLLPVRYLMVIGFTVLALLHTDKLHLQSVQGIDFEHFLPVTIIEFTPSVVRGILVVGLMAAFMGTFAGALNTAQSYLVNDVYLKYINPNASLRRVMNMNYVFGLSVVVASIVLGFYSPDAYMFSQTIVAALTGGYVVANVLKWHWWRFNANGFAWGMLAGTFAALIFPMLLPDIQLLWLFPAFVVISLVGCVVGSLTTPATDDRVLMNFYKTVRPWGFWQPIHNKVVAKDPHFRTDANPRLDVLNVAIGLVAQGCLILLPMYFVLSMSLPLALVVVVLLVCGFILKRTWWNKLKYAKTTPSVFQDNKQWKTIV